MLTTSGKRAKQRPTISDVAWLAGVSISTVSRVVNDTAPVSDEVGVRVRNAIELLGYTPHVAARNLAVRHTTTIGLLLPELSSSFFTPLLRGIEAAVRQTDYDLLIYREPAGRCGVRSAPAAAHWGPQRRRHDRLHDDVGRPRAGSQLRSRFSHGAAASPVTRGIEVPTVLFDNRAGVRLAVNHLIEAHNRRRIVFLHGPLGNQESDERRPATAMRSNSTA